MGDIQLTQEQQTELADTFGFMRDLCDAASAGLTGLQVKVAPGSSEEDVRDVSAEGIIIIQCKPMDLPQPPTSQGDGCYLPEGIIDRFAGVTDVEGLGMLFEHLTSICREIQAAYGGSGAEES